MPNLHLRIERGKEERKNGWREGGSRCNEEEAEEEGMMESCCDPSPPLH
jgi:hypothetical protein